MADVTIIAPNAVELVGSIVRPANGPPAVDLRRFDALKGKVTQQQSAGVKTQAQPRPSIPQPSNDSLSRQDSQNEPPAKRFQDPLPQRPSTPFLTQKIAQESTFRAQSLKRFDKAIAAYQRTLANGEDERERVAFVTRTLDLRI